MMLSIYNPKTIDVLKYVNLSFDGVSKKCLVVDIIGEEYRLCDEVSEGKNFWANSKPGVYGQGLCSTEYDEFKPVRVGLLGQMAFGKFIGEPVDLTYREGGDHQDSLYCGKRVDVKCSIRNCGRGLVYHFNEWGREVDVDKDIYVFGFLQDEDWATSRAVVILVGYADLEVVRGCPVKHGCVGFKEKKHLNYEVPYSCLNPVSEMLSWRVVTY